MLKKMEDGADECTQFYPVNRKKIACNLDGPMAKGVKEKGIEM